MTWEEFKKKLKELGIEYDDRYYSDIIHVFHYSLSFSKDGWFDTGDFSRNIVKGMSYEDMYKILEIICKYRSK